MDEMNNPNPPPSLDDSILQSVKKIIGIVPECTDFDLDLIVHINTAFSILYQLGLDDKIPYSITNSNDKWSDILQDRTYLELVKSYVALKVKSIFDTPTIGTVNESLNNMIRELEWRISVLVDPVDNIFKPIQGGDR